MIFISCWLIALFYTVQAGYEKLGDDMELEWTFIDDETL